MKMADEPWYTRNSPKIGKKWREFHDTLLLEKSALDQKTKYLLMTALASAFRCSHCTQSNIKEAFEAGATKEEVAEALLIAALAGSGTQLYWAKEIFEKYL
jgi:AhpD family alkylhydroperoxidase